MKIRWIGFLVVSVALAAVGLTGCGRSGAVHSGGHAHTAKYGGILVEVGEHEFNLEVLVEPVAGKLSIWTLDAHAEDYKRITAKTLEVLAKVNGGPEKSLTVKAVANPATGETEGDSAQFETTADWLKGAKDVAGVVKSITFGGKNFTDLKFDWPHGKAEGHKH